jgi:mannitol-1-phosphate 5-dehydrogenase
MDGSQMKKIVAYGAGNIGRGFVGQLFHESGYEVVFIDVNKKVVDKLNDDRKYPIKIISSEEIREIVIDDVRAVDGTDAAAVAGEISGADIMATAVGVNVLPRIIGPILMGLRKRWSDGNYSPLNIIICENLIDSSKYMKELFLKELHRDEVQKFNDTVGLVEASIGRMVPVMTEQMQEGNILRVWVEEYCMFPVDRDGFIGKIPDIKNLVPYSPFSYYIQRKLFIHNLGHAIVAYLGYISGYEYVWQGIGDRIIRRIAESAMIESAQAISKEHGIPLEVITDHVGDLVARFGNARLGDTVKRVGGDPLRKLSYNDRLIGAARLCLKHGISPVFICFGAWAALRFDPSEDVSAMRLQKLLAENKTEDVLMEVCGIGPGSMLSEMIIGRE